MYKSYCLDCKDQNKGGVDVYRYVGETGRSFSERVRDHWDDCWKGKEDSHILKHWVNIHGGVGEPKFHFEIANTFHNALSRQIAEAVRVRRRGRFVLNHKGV